MTVPSDPLSTQSVRKDQLASELARSWLLVAAARPEAFDGADSSMADAIILDFENAVDPTRKAQAREAVIDWLGHRGEAWVRINDAASDFWADDVAALLDAPGLLGVVLAKTERPEDVTATFEGFAQKLPVVALVESALGIEEAVGIARAEGAF